MTEWLDQLYKIPGWLALLGLGYVVWSWDGVRDRHAEQHTAEMRALEQLVNELRTESRAERTNLHMAQGDDITAVLDRHIREIAELAKDLDEDSIAMRRRAQENVRNASDARDDLERNMAARFAEFNAALAEIRERLANIVDSSRARIEGEIMRLRSRIERLESRYFPPRTYPPQE